MNFVEQQDQIDFLVKPSWFLPGTKQWTKKFLQIKATIFRLLLGNNCCFD